MDLVLIRHPAVAIDAGVCYGCSDVPLADAVDASVTGILSRTGALRVPAAQALWSSPLTRCAAIAESLGRHAGTPVRYDACLREIDFGTWELRRWDAIGKDALDRWAADLMEAREHGGESAAQFAARVQPMLSHVNAGAEVSWVVTHAGVIRALVSQALGVSLDTLLQRRIAMSGIVWLRSGCEPKHAWELVSWDE